MRAFAGAQACLQPYPFSQTRSIRIATLCLGHKVLVYNGDLRDVRFGDVVSEGESSHVDELSGDLDENGLAVHGHVVEPLQIVGIGYEEAPAVAPAGDGEPLRSWLALLQLLCSNRNGATGSRRSRWPSPACSL